MNTILAWAQKRTRLFFLLVVLALIVMGFGIFAAGVTVWEYTNSSQFCGTVCHTMPPEYAAYQTSPHARVPCVNCHLGRESVLSALPRKALEIRHVIFALTQTYETPIFVKSLRPARFTCEKCHYPHKFSSDRLIVRHHYATDEKNSEYVTTLIMKVGGGSKQEGLGKGVHWHIENPVWFIATDELRQHIPYVRQIDENGNPIEYFDVDANLPPDFVERNQDKLHRMDCIDCHNRISHQFPNPDQALDDALFRHKIARDIPEIKKLAVDVLSAPYPDQETALKGIERLVEIYRIKYPEWYAKEANKAKLHNAIEQLKAMYTRMIFPDMKVSWDVHPDNIGHKYFPGCFRCHDGKHFNRDGQPIRLECNLCHSIPVVIGPGLPAMPISLVKPEQPDSHRDPMWIAIHRFEFDHSCAGCHNVTNAGGKDNSGFCANSACHATEWPYMGLDAAEVRRLIEERLKAKQATKPALPPDVAAPIPHPVGPRIDCEVCHGLTAVLPYPEDHIQENMKQCVDCHHVTHPEEVLSEEGRAR